MWLLLEILILISYQSTSKCSNDFKDILSDYSMVQHITTPTHITDTSAILIDHALTTPNLNVNRYQTLDLSDHQILEVDIPVIRSKRQCTMVHSLWSCPWDEVRESLSTAPWQVIDIYDSVDDMWEFIKTILTECLSKFAPLHPVKCKGSHRHTPWLTPSLLSNIQNKCKAKRKAELTG